MAQKAVLQASVRSFVREDDGTIVIFTGSRIAIVSGFAPNRRGYISTGPDQDERWFRAATNPQYLAEKFLLREWSARRAIAELDDAWADEDHEIHQAGPVAYKEARNACELAIERGKEEEVHAIGLIIDLIDTKDGVPGEGFPEADVRWLAELQRDYARSR